MNTRERAIKSSESYDFIALLREVPEAWIPEMEERAAVMEYDGGLSREDAEIAVAAVMVRVMGEGSS